MKYTIYILFLLNFFVVPLSAQEHIAFYFETNKHEFTKAEQLRFEEWVRMNADVKIVGINGFTDEVGSVGFNDTLASKRVQFTFLLLKNRLKIREDFKSRSFGKNHEQLEDKAKNRRVDIHYILAKDLSRENEILGIKANINPKINKTPKQYPSVMEVRNPNGSISKFELDEKFMQAIDTASVGQKLKIENLNFVLNTFIVENDSRGKLFELLMVMQQNPQLKIEIQGHICCNAADRNNLSSDRAKAIKNFLVAYDIDGARVRFKGFKGEQPIYPIPEKNDEERAANRRVEILILEN